jgi:hypothetical protein
MEQQDTDFAYQSSGGSDSDDADKYIETRTAYNTFACDNSIIPGFPKDSTTHRPVLCRYVLQADMYPILLLGLKETKGELVMPSLEGGYREAGRFAGTNGRYDGFVLTSVETSALVVTFSERDESLHWVIASEVVNCRHSFGVPISESVRGLLMRHLYLTTLLEEGIIAPTPSVWYVESDIESIPTRKAAGPRRLSVDDPMGPFYKLYSWERCPRGSTIVKYAVFEEDVASVAYSRWFRDRSTYIADDGSFIVVRDPDQTYCIDWSHSSESSS